MTLVAIVVLSLPSRDESPEARVLAYLAAEVPRWSLENHCYSCHNNGDAARALYAAIRLGRTIEPKATLETDRWLGRPEGWDKNGGDGPASDKALARVQFASALVSALDSGRIQDRTALTRAADRLAGDQQEDGSWPVEDEGRVGSPATYGRALATWMARETLAKADPVRFRDRIGRADGWLGRLEPSNILESSTVLLASGEDRETDRSRRTLEILRRGQAASGGWGPFAKSAPEAFDTALALLALDRHRDRPGVLEAIGRGRAFLIATQNEDGSWTETTRPSGAESYAQRLSTTGWAALALLVVQDSRVNR